MSATTGFDLSGLTELVNETEFGMLWYSEPILKNNTVTTTELDGIVLTGAKQDKYKLPTMSATATLQDGSDCGFDPVDEASFDQTDLNMVSLKIQGQFCPRLLEPFWLAAGLPKGQHYANFNPLQANIMAEIANQIQRKLAVFPYYGPTGTDSVVYTDNWISLLQGAGGSILIASGDGTNGGPTGGDAEGVYNRVQAAIMLLLANADTSAGIMEDNRYFIEMSPYDAALYYQNLETLQGQNTVAPLQSQFATGIMTSWVHPGTRVKIVVVNALSLGREIILLRARNKVLAFDLASDNTRIKMGMDQHEEYIWWTWRTKIGTAFRSLSPDDVRWYGPVS